MYTTKRRSNQNLYGMKHQAESLAFSVMASGTKMEQSRMHRAGYPRETAAKIRRCRDSDMDSLRVFRTIFDTLKAMNIVMKNSEVHARIPRPVKNLQLLDVWLKAVTKKIP
mmetsp:Transcript_31414/g.58599  ORF Transcript_31414/g.58599 Transcript_31414/m.58599 type:complete len:111 (-) Transcript_31414:209-541(-)